MYWTLISTQVSNRAACIKIAYDFLPVAGIAASRQVTEEFRADSLPDILHLDAMLWHALHSINENLMHLPDDPPPTARQPPESYAAMLLREVRRSQKTAQRAAKRKRSPSPSQARRGPSARVVRSLFKCPFKVCKKANSCPVTGIFSHM